MKKYDQRLLIISNNVLSYTRNNGKTILSYVDSLPKECVQQLYFSQESPEVCGYKYFQISDIDVIKGRINSLSRGRSLTPLMKSDMNKITKKVERHSYNTFFRLIREVVWLGGWKSKQLLDWLNEFKPTAVFFVGADCCFAYTICKFIVNKFKVPLTLFITDDYFMPRKKENILQIFRRKLIRKKVVECINLAKVFFTISEPMRIAYLNEFNRDSIVAVNMPEPLKDNTNHTINEKITMVYAGSLYYGRDKVLGEISKIIFSLNQILDKEIVLKIFSNISPSEKELKNININENVLFCGSLDKMQLKQELNSADILVFVESFEKKEMEKTKYSLSTKVPEYLSLGKPILAVGPDGIGSMDYLKDVAICVNDYNDLYLKVKNLVSNQDLQNSVANNAYNKYIKNHIKNEQQEKFLQRVFM